MSELPIFIKQLRVVKSVMEHSSHEELHMDRWILPNSNGNLDTPFNCEYAACVCGHVAINADYEHFPATNEHMEDLINYHGEGYKPNFDDYGQLASLINLDMQVACTRQLGEQYLSDSINCLYDRHRLAVRSHLFDIRELSVIDHLTAKVTTPDYVYQYVDLIIKKLIRQL